MSTHDPNCVYVTNDLREAELIVVWLRQQGLEAEIQTHLKESDGVGLGVYNNSDMWSRLEIHIKDLERVEEVRELISQNEEELLQPVREIEAAPLEDILVACEACGNTALFPSEMQGTVQDCPHCGAYLDVPGGEDEFDWSIVDETVAEDDMPVEDDEEDDAWG
ncbi:MAG: hypothetical protein KDA76_01090 [Planctomycetaceae bacterium]|nr:hypothetical protein [Planctomycetaceae bacterium]